MRAKYLLTSNQNLFLPSLEMCGWTKFERRGLELKKLREKNDSEDCCGDQKERSIDIMSHMLSCLFLLYDVMMQM